jgi:hypothetical protein
MTNKIPVKDILAAIDMNAKSIWKELDSEQKKSVSFWLLNRYASNVAGKREKQELAVLKTNEYYNKNYMLVTKHPELQWQLLCLCGSTGKIEFHKWQGLKQKDNKSDATAKKFLKQIFPTMKDSDIDTFIKLNNKKDLALLIEDHGFEKVKL